MSASAKNNKFFLLSFLPALAYWYLESKYPLKIAITGGLLLALLEISLEKIFFKHIHTLSKFNFFLLLFLGGLSLLGEDGIWFKLQPFFTGLILGCVMIFYLSKGKGLMGEMAGQMGNSQLPDHIFRQLEWHTAFFMMIYGCFMGGVAFLGTTTNWVFFKTAGFYIAFFIFMIFEIFFMRRQMRKEALNKQKQEIMRRF